MIPSSNWADFSTFLDTLAQNNPGQQAPPGQIPEWSNNFQLGQDIPPPQQVPGYQPQYPGVPAAPQIPGYQGAQGGYATPQQQAPTGVQAQVLGNADASNPMAAFMNSLGQGQRHNERMSQRMDERQQNSGGFGFSSYRNRAQPWNSQR